jgi:Tol biopolymer transport system component
MPELREVFETTTKQMGEPDVDSWREQVRRQRRTSRNKRLGALAVAATIGLVAVAVVIRAADDGTGTQPGIQPTPTPPAGTAPETAYLIDLNTGEMTPLPKSIAGCCYAVSPDGTMVAYSSLDDAGSAQVFIARLDGTDVQQVTQRGAFGPFDWSPDGGAIAYTSGDEEDVTNIFVLDLATRETSQVTNEKPMTETCVGCGPFAAAYPQFSPDGASIVYVVNRGGDLDVRIVPVTGGKSVLLVRGAVNLPTLSPDGSTLAVGCGDRFGGGICIGHADGTNLRQLVSGSANGPKWSPVGTRIAYNDGDDNKIFVVDVATGETTLVAKVSGPAQFELEWSPGGRRIAYVDADQPIGEFKIFVVDVATGETTFVAEGIAAEWLDDHTLIIEREGG